MSGFTWVKAKKKKKNLFCNCHDDNVICCDKKRESAVYIRYKSSTRQQHLSNLKILVAHPKHFTETAFRLLMSTGPEERKWRWKKRGGGGGEKRRGGGG